MQNDIAGMAFGAADADGAPQRILLQNFDLQQAMSVAPARVLQVFRAQWCFIHLDVPGHIPLDESPSPCRDRQSSAGKSLSGVMRKGSKNQVLGCPGWNVTTLPLKLPL